MYLTKQERIVHRSGNEKQQQQQQHGNQCFEILH